MLFWFFKSWFFLSGKIIPIKSNRGKYYSELVNRNT